MNIISTAFTRPRISSGVFSCTRVPRVTTLTMSVAPTKRSDASESAKLRESPKTAVKAANKVDVPMLYWTAASWGSAISVSKDHPDLIADQPIVEALIDRALELDPDFDFGAIHGFLINYEMARQGAAGNAAARARQHFDRVVVLTNGQLASPFVSLAEAVSVASDNRAEFEKLLKQALAIDPDARVEWRLQNLVVQKRARWLLARVDDLFSR